MINESFSIIGGTCLGCHPKVYAYEHGCLSGTRGSLENPINTFYQNDVVD